MESVQDQWQKQQQKWEEQQPPYPTSTGVWRRWSCCVVLLAPCAAPSRSWRRRGNTKSVEGARNCSNSGKSILFPFPVQELQAVYDGCCQRFRPETLWGKVWVVGFGKHQSVWQISPVGIDPAKQLRRRALPKHELPAACELTFRSSASPHSRYRAF